MKLRRQQHGTVVVVSLDEALAGEEAIAFQREVEESIESKHGRVVIDMHGVSYLDSAGIEALLDLCGERRATSMRPRLALLGETCREALDITNALDQLDVFDTVENAIRSYKR